MRIKILLLVLFSVLFLNGLNAQKKSVKTTISGTVLDLDDKPIVNAIIIIDNQKTNILTDSAGNYSVKVNATASKIGVMTFGNGYLEEDIDNRDTINISFGSIAKVTPVKRSDDDPNSEEAELRGRQMEGEVGVNMGYGFVKRKYLVGDIDFIDATDKKYISYSSAKEMIVRDVSGITQFGDKIIILGSRDLGGYVEPVVLIDGVYAQTKDLSDLHPSTIRSIAVLKGASSAIYGSRGYGGAILVTTRISN